MLKNISDLGTILKKSEQQSINGGLSAVTCNSPYFVQDGVCNEGGHPHPIYGHCLCCR